MREGPYLSFVVAARNDNYGGDFKHRMQVFVNVLAGWALRHELNAELIIVEWNPPSDRLSLKEQIEWPANLGPLRVRLVEVPHAVHARLPNSGRLPLFEYIAKNVGIRRAQGSYILATNPDLVYSGELVGWLAARRLSPGKYYRIDRYDFTGPAPLSLDPEEVVRFAKRHVFVAHFRSAPPRGNSQVVGGLRRRLGVHAGLWPSSCRYYLRAGPGQCVRTLDDDTGLDGGIHTNAAGDFILAHRDHWHAIKGFPEFTDTFTHLDSYACHQLKAVGLSQTVFIPPAMILHADHSRVEQKGRPQSPNEKVDEDLRKIRSGQLGAALNGEGWGLRDDALVEIAIQ